MSHMTILITTVCVVAPCRCVDFINSLDKDIADNKNRMGELDAMIKQVAFPMKDTPARAFGLRDPIMFLLLNGVSEIVKLCFNRRNLCTNFVPTRV